ncbi:MAG: RDD family protein [Candidatus Berkiellales bacterium]
MLTYRSAPILKRCAAFIYDSFIVVTFLLLMTAFALMLNQGHSLLPYRIYFLIYLFLTTGLFLSWIWHTRGQTIGMLAWKIKVLDPDQQKLSWSRAFYRYCTAFITLSCGGIGLLWCLIDKDKQSLYDRIAGTRLISLTSFKQNQTDNKK